MSIGLGAGLAVGLAWGWIGGGDGESGAAAPAVRKALSAGNAAFVEARGSRPRIDAARRSEVASGQHPCATIVTCSDSRVVPERIFDQGLGDLFVIRVAGNVCDTDEIGTIEYGVGHLHTPLLLVMGHTKCGAVTAVASQEPVAGHIPQLVDNIGPAVAAVRRLQPDIGLEALIAASIRSNVFQAIQDVLARSDEVRGLAAAGKLRIEGAIYDIATGQVEWLGEHPQHALLVTAAPRKPEGAVGPAPDPHAPDAATGVTIGGAAGMHADSTEHAAAHAKPVGGDAAARAGKSHDPAGHDAASPGAPSPRGAEALAKLVSGNDRFAAEKCSHPHSDLARRAEIAGGQHPFATVVCCSDSRVAPELVLDQGLGDVFVVRVAGNVCDTDEIGSVEYGVGHLKTPLLVVMGHTKCGAVTAVCQKSELHGCVRELVDNIGPAVEAARRKDAKLEGEALIREAVRWNVFQSIADLLTRSAEVREALAADHVRVVGAVYDLDSGRIEWLGPHPEEPELKRGGPRGDASKVETSPGAAQGRPIE